MSTREHCNHHPADCDGAACAGSMVREGLAAAYDPAAFDPDRKIPKHPATQIQWAARRKLALDAADRVLASDWLAKNAAEVRAEALRDAAVALEVERLARPFNGDGSNYMLDKVIRRLDAVAGNDGPSMSAEMEKARRKDVAEARYCELHGQDLPLQTHVERLKLARAGTAEVGADD